MAKKIIRGIGIILAVGILSGLVVYGVFIAPANDSPFNETRFRQDAWTAPVGNDVTANLRAPMAADVKKRIIKTGMLRAEVRNLLGTPDESRMGDELSGHDIYTLGHSGQMSFGSDRLIITYTKAGKVASTHISGR